MIFLPQYLMSRLVVLWVPRPLILGDGEQDEASIIQG